MCLIALALGASARWPLVIAANRDEFWARPTTPLALWQTPRGRTVLSGRDLRAGGTWMGASPGGRVAFLTNVREPHAAERNDAARLISRGNLVTRWLEGLDDTPSAMAGALQAEAQSTGAAYAGFNLVVGDTAHGLWHYIHHQRGDLRSYAVNTADDVRPWTVAPLPPGIYGLSNAALNTPWPKTLHLKSALQDALLHADDADDADALKRQLWHALADSTRCTLESLPSTGVPPAAELALSSVWVDFPEQHYGTRSSAVWLATASNDAANLWDVTFEERSFARPAAHHTATTHAMQWAHPAV